MNRTLFLIIAILISPISFAEVLYDDLPSEAISQVKEPNIHTKYNYQDTDIVPINLSVSQKIKSESELYEGQIVEFRALKHAVYKDKTIIKRGTVVPARVKMIITSGMNGIPASIIFEDFKIEGVKSSQLSDSVEIFGQDRSLFVFPLKWALTILPPTGSLTNFIKGGHAKLKTNKTITIYYHPNWI